MKNPKQKGSAFERECARNLSLWWTEGERDDCVWRTSGSGATHTNRAKKGKQTTGQAGDLCAQDEEMLPFFDHFLVECKSGYASNNNPGRTISVLYCIDRTPTAKGDPLIIKWWTKAVRESEQANRQDVFFIFKRTGRIPCVMLKMSTLRKLQDYAGRYEWDRVNLIYPSDLEEDPYRLSLSIIPWEDFAEWCPGKCIRKYMIDESAKMRGMSRRRIK